MKNVSEFFGCKVFDDRVMKANLTKVQSLILAWPMQLQQL